MKKTAMFLGAMILAGCSSPERGRGFINVVESVRIQVHVPSESDTGIYKIKPYALLEIDPEENYSAKDMEFSGNHSIQKIIPPFRKEPYKPN